MRVAIILLHLVNRNGIGYQATVRQISPWILAHATPIELPHEISDLVRIHRLGPGLPEVRHLLSWN